MKTVLIGLGIQGNKRLKLIKEKCIGIVDIVSEEVKYTDIKQVPLNTYQAAFVCTPDGCKYEILEYLLSNKKHVLVEKPLFFENHEKLLFLKDLAKEKKVTLYTAYNHRFEPNIIKAKEIIDSNILGKIYYCRLFYGNGTSQDIKSSLWRKKSKGVLTDLGSHLLDLLLYFFSEKISDDFSLISCNSFESGTIDHAVIYSKNSFPIFMEMSYICWKNNFKCDLFFEKGSIHIDSLCKWGASSFTIRKRVYPSGKPIEEKFIMESPDFSWQKEHAYFFALSEKKESNIQNDIKINRILNSLINQVI